MEEGQDVEMEEERGDEDGFECCYQPRAFGLLALCDGLFANGACVLFGRLEVWELGGADVDVFTRVIPVHAISIIYFGSHDVNYSLVRLISNLIGAP